MRQSRDGDVQIIDAGPRQIEPGLLALLANPRWPIALTWFMRTLAWVWVAKGLFNWSVVLGCVRVAQFGMLPHALQDTIVFFAAADLIAGVGLWLAAPWGGAVWLLCATAEAITPLMGSRGSFMSTLGVSINVVLIAVYLLLSWRAGRSRY